MPDDFSESHRVICKFKLILGMYFQSALPVITKASKIQYTIHKPDRTKEGRAYVELYKIKE